MRILLLLFICSSVFAKTHTEFVAHANTGMTVRGKSDVALGGKLNIDGNKVKGIAKFQLSSFDTGIKLRNTHMKEKYLEVEKFPLAELEIKDGRDSNWSGVLLLHGNKNVVNGRMDLSNQTKQFTFLVELNKFDIEAPSFMGIKIQNTVEVSVEITNEEIVSTPRGYIK